MKLRKTVVFASLISISFVAVFGYHFLEGQKREEARLAKINNYSFYEPTARQMAMFQSNDPSLSLKSVMLVYNKSLKSPVYAIYGYSSILSGFRSVSLDLVTGQKTELPTHIKTFFDGKSFGDLSIEKKTLTGVWEVFRGSKKTWTTLYITKKGNSLVGEAYFFDDFTNIGDKKTIEF